MNTQSIETQQNANSQPQNSKIAEIYHRMLMGEKSALASLQKLKTPTSKQLIKTPHHPNPDDQSPQFQRQKYMNRTQIDHKLQHHYTIKDSPFDRIKTINEEPLQESMLKQTQKDKQKEKLRSYIKKKVNQLRNEKQIMRNHQDKQINDIKPINDTDKIFTINQSKSYDLVKRKEFVHKTANATNSGMPSAKEQVKKVFQSINTKQAMIKAQSSSKTNYSKQLPPLKQRKKIPTQNSQQNHGLAESKVIPRKDVRTPINLAESNLKAQMKSTDSQQGKSKDSPTRSVKNDNMSNRKKQESRVKKISLPQMRRLREEFALINQQEKSAQLDVMQYHQQTKLFVEEVRARNQLNFRNFDRLNEMKNCLNPEPISTTLKTIHSSLKSQHPDQSKKKLFAVEQEKIQQGFEDIKLIEEAIAKKRSQVSKIEAKLSQNLLSQFWDSYDLQQYDFAQDDELSEVEIFQSDSISQSKITEAYSTAMPETKDKKWKRKAIKQYDTNRSFQEYAKSRSQFKPGKVIQQSNSLNRIEQTEQEEQDDNGVNKVTVNSQLRKLLLQ